MVIPEDVQFTESSSVASYPWMGNMGNVDDSPVL